jgi:hypothetical protein
LGVVKSASAVYVLPELSPAANPAPVVSKAAFGVVAVAVTVASSVVALIVAVAVGVG